MSLQNILFVFVICAVLGVLLVAESAKPKQINWQPSYSASDQNPYGAYILRQELPELFPAQQIVSQDRTIYEIFKQNLRHFKKGDVNYIFINRIFSPGDADFDNLMSFVENGGQVFISAQLFEKSIAARLGIKTSYFFINAQDSLALRMLNPLLDNKKSYGFKRGTVSEYFQKYDKTTTSVLAVNSRNKPILLQKNYGKGSFYLNSTPLAFSNYHMVLADNSEFAAKVLSYLPDQAVYWDEYYKEGRIQNDSRLRFILSRESLRWAWWITIGGLIIFVVFEGRRTQRVIPVLRPLPNTTLEFTETVGKLYYQRRNHKNIAEKRITHFLEYVRTHMYISTHEFNEEFIEKIISKTNHPRKQVLQLFKLIKRIQQKIDINDTELLYLSSHIDRLKAAYEGKPLNTVTYFKRQRKHNTHLIFGRFWIVLGSIASLAYSSAPSVDNGNAIFIFLGVILLGSLQLLYGLNQQIKEKQNRVVLIGSPKKKRKK